MRKAAIILFVLSFGVQQQLCAQFKNNDTKKENFAALLADGQKSSGGLSALLGIDPGRLHMTQSYMMSYGTIGGRSLSQGIYLNTLQYDFKLPLKLQLQWGMAHNPLQASGIQSPLKSGLFLSGASLEYQPAKNVKLELGISSYPQHEYYLSPFSHRQNRLFD